MATVVLAEDMLLGRQVALKRLLGTSTSAHGGVRLRREALVGASLRHPNLVTVYDVIESDTSGDVIVVMEYVAGETLARRMAREGRLPPAEVVRILEGVAAALDAIHERGIVHRDVKPANILLGDDGAVKLADLGIVLLQDRTRITSQGAVVGSFRYMAPEQLGEGPITRAVDVYALATVAYEMLSGRKARTESNLIAMARALATQPPPDVREAWPEAPARVVRLLKTAMSREPEARPGSAGELVSRLRATLAPETPVCEARTALPRRPVPPLGSAARPLRRVYRSSRLPRRRMGGRSRRGEAMALGALLAVAALAAVLVLANPWSGTGPRRGSHGSQVALRSRQRSSARRSRSSSSVAAKAARTRAASRRQAANGSAAKASGAANGSGTSSGSATASGYATSVASNPSGSAQSNTASGSSGANGSGGTSRSATAGGPAPPSQQAAAAPVPATPTGTSTPIMAAETFYRLASTHDYPGAWALADPTMRAELGGYDAFRYQQQEDQGVHFDSVRVIDTSGGAATIAVATTASLTAGTKHCSGTVDLVSAAGGWRLHQIHITCS